MITQAKNVAPFYEGWRFAQDRCGERIAELSPEQLQLRAAAHVWPIWAIAAHAAAVRPYWLCHIFKEPGAERTPFNDPDGDGWEDDLTHPREAGELVSALESTWTIVEDCLQQWPPAMLAYELPRALHRHIHIHTRQGVLTRLLTPCAY